MSLSLFSRVCGLALTVAGVGVAHATEGQQLRALLGAPGQEMTVPQNPGLYGQLWYQHYEATRFLDGGGHRQAIDVGNGVEAERGGAIVANVVVPRLTYLSETYWGEGRLGVSATIPMIDLTAHTTLTGRFPTGFPDAMKPYVQAQLNAAAAGASDSTTAQGDMEVAPFIDFQDDTSRVILMTAFVVPTGDYNKDNVVNAGAGRFWTWRPGFVYGRAWDNGLEFGTRVTYSFNGVNTATHVRSGQYLHADYSLLYRYSDLWRFGLQGYAVKQFTKDTGPGVAADGNKAQTYALGPSVGYQSEDGEFAAELKVLPEFHARNRPEGTTSWLRLMFRLD